MLLGVFGVDGRGHVYTAVGPVTRVKTVVTPRVRDRCPGWGHMPSVSRVPRGGGAPMALYCALCVHWRQLHGGAGGCSPVAAACTMLSAVVRTLPSGSRRGNQGVAQPSL